MDLEQAPLFHNVILQVRETNGDALAGPEWAKTSGVSVEAPSVSHIAGVMLPTCRGWVSGLTLESLLAFMQLSRILILARNCSHVCCPPQLAGKVQQLKTPGSKSAIKTSVLQRTIKVPASFQVMLLPSFLSLSMPFSR